MTRELTFTASDRLLVFAPHPDDETIATGELIQLANAAGANVRVVFATDGDNNPWPQRWIERRFRIGAAERARWGQRRRVEAMAALEALGLDADAARFLGWPDQTLTSKLLHDPSAVDTLANEIAAFSPTHVAMPSLRDRHPDHGALRVMLDLALAKSASACMRLGYVVHGRVPSARDWQMTPDPVRHERKRCALIEHASQIRLSRRRLMRWVEQGETFEWPEDDVAGATLLPAADRILRIPLPSSHRIWRRHEVLIVIGGRRRIERARVLLPRFVRASARSVLAEGLCSGRVTVELIGHTLQITFAATTDSVSSAYVKLERTWPRVVIFDADTWQRLEDFPAASTGEAVLTKTQVPERISV